MTPNINKTLRENPRSSKFCAPMGSKSYFDAPDEKLYVQRITLIDGDYAPDGTYFGGSPSPPLWCAFSDSNRIYVRGKDRAEAIKAVLADYPEAKFIKK